MLFTVPSGTSNKKIGNSTPPASISGYGFKMMVNDTTTNGHMVDGGISQEILGIERRLKDWFLTRRLQMERHISIKHVLEYHGLTG